MSDNPQRVGYPLKRERATFEQPDVMEVYATGPKIPAFRVQEAEFSCQRTNPIAFPRKGWNQHQSLLSGVQEPLALVPYSGLVGLQNAPIPQGICQNPIGISCYFPGCSCQASRQPTVNILPMLLVPVVPPPSLQLLGVHPLAQVGPSHQVSSADWEKVMEYCRHNPVYNSPLGKDGLDSLLNPKGPMKLPQPVKKVPRDKIVFWQDIHFKKTGTRGTKLHWERLPSEEKTRIYRRWRELKTEAKWQKEQKLIEAL